MFASAAASLHTCAPDPRVDSVPALVMQIVDECCKNDGTAASKRLMTTLVQEVANAYDTPEVVRDSFVIEEPPLVCAECGNDDEFDLSDDGCHPVCCGCGMVLAGACVPADLVPFERPPPASRAPVEDKTRSFYKRTSVLLDLVHQRLMAVGFGVVDSHGDYVAEVLRRLEAAKPYIGELHTSTNVARAVAIFAYHLRPHHPQH